MTMQGSFPPNIGCISESSTMTEVVGMISSQIALFKIPQM